MTSGQLTSAISNTIKDFAVALEPLLKEASQRLLQEPYNGQLKKCHRYGVQVLGYLENEKPRLGNGDL